MRHAVTPARCSSRSEYKRPHRARPRRIASQTPRVASRRVASRRVACSRRVSCTYYHRCNARKRTISIIIINPTAQRDRKMHLARDRTGNSRMHEDNTLHVIIKGRGRKLHIYRDHHLQSILHCCVCTYVGCPCETKWVSHNMKYCCSSAINWVSFKLTIRANDRINRNILIVTLITIYK